MSTTYILSIETATPVCSVSLFSEQQLIHTVRASAENMHANELTLCMQRLLDETEVSFNQLSAIAVSKGPGSYTGLRIGVSAAKGLCYALDIPLIGINSLSAMLGGYRSNNPNDDTNLLYCPMIDARRQEVYTLMQHGELGLIKETHALIVDADTFTSYTDQGWKPVLFGSGADKFIPLFENNKQIQIIPQFESLASYQLEMAYACYQAKQFEDIAYFEPYYLKDFIATQPKKILL